MRSKVKTTIFPQQAVLFSGLCSTLISAHAQSASATIDGSKAGAPNSKNIYGQFLEHIGGIVNNGIWAERPDDREFYYPITSHPPNEPATTTGSRRVGMRQ